METFLISLIAFGLAFAAMAIGCSRGRPLGSHGCGDCPARRNAEEGGTRCRP